MLILTSQYSRLCGQHIILLLFPLNNSYHNGQCLCCLPAATHHKPLTALYTCCTLPAAGCEHLRSFHSVPQPSTPRLTYPAACSTSDYILRQDRWRAVPPHVTGHCTLVGSHHSTGAFRHPSIMTGASLGEKYPLFFILANLFR